MAPKFICFKKFVFFAIKLDLSITNAGDSLFFSSSNMRIFLVYSFYSIDTVTCKLHGNSWLLKMKTVDYLCRLFFRRVGERKGYLTERKR